MTNRNKYLCLTLAVMGACGSPEASQPIANQSPSPTAESSATRMKPQKLSEAEDEETPPDSPSRSSSTAADTTAPSEGDAAKPAQADPAEPEGDCPRFIAFPEPESLGPPQAASSQQDCLCYPTGGVCKNSNNPGGPPLKADPELACPEGEVCDGALDVGYSTDQVFGACRKRCNHPSSDVPFALGCASDEYCALVDIVLGDNLSTSVGLCMPDSQLPRGGWDWTGCADSKK